MSDKKYRKNPAVVFRQIGDECILVPIHKGQGDFETIYSLNETAGRIWQMIEPDKTLQQLSQQLAQEYKIKFEQIVCDLKAYIAQLVEINAISLV